MKDLNFVDGLYLLAHGFKDMEMKLKDLELEAARFGLKSTPKSEGDAVKEFEHYRTYTRRRRY